MFNLLPEKEKKELFREYRLRRGILWLSVAFLLGVLFCIFLIPSFLISSSKGDEVERRIESVRQSTIFEETDVLNQRLTTASLKIKTFENFSISPPIHDVFEKVTEMRGSDIRIRGLQYRKSEDPRAAMILVAGVARDRNSLRDFVKELEQHENFARVNLPVASFAREQNLDFSLEITAVFD